MSEDKLKFWDERVTSFDLAGSNDYGIKNFEMSTLDKFIEDGMKALDLGWWQWHVCISFCKK